MSTMGVKLAAPFQAGQPGANQTRMAPAQRTRPSSFAGLSRHPGAARHSRRWTLVDRRWTDRPSKDYRLLWAGSGLSCCFTWVLD
jgi:hypothetical protein